MKKGMTTPIVILCGEHVHPDARAVKNVDGLNATAEYLILVVLPDYQQGQGGTDIRAIGRRSPYGKPSGASKMPISQGLCQIRIADDCRV